VKEPNMFLNYETEKITCKAMTWQKTCTFSSCSVLPPEIVMLFSVHPPIYASCMTISSGRTEQLNIIVGFLPHHWLYKWFSSAENVRWYMRHAWRSRVEEEPNNTL